MNSPTVEEMDKYEQLVEDLLGGAWERHSAVESDRTEKTLNRAGEIREAYFDG